MIACIFTCTFNENQLKIIDNTCNNYISILFEPLRPENLYPKIIPLKCHKHLNLKYIMNLYQVHVINLIIETDLFNQYFPTIPIIIKIIINNEMRVDRRSLFYICMLTNLSDIVTHLLVLL